MPIDNVQPEQQPNSDMQPIASTSSPDIGNTIVVGSPSLSCPIMEFVYIDDPSVSEELRQMCRENSKRLKDEEAKLYAFQLSRPKILDEIYSKT